MWKVLLALLISSLAFAENAKSVRLIYSSTPVGTVTPVTLISSMPKVSANGATVFDSSGKTMQLIIATPGGTSTYVIVPTGSNSFPLQVNQGDKVSIIALSSTASTGELDVNFFY